MLDVRADIHHSKLRQVAEGLAYLHGEGIVHGGLQAVRDQISSVLLGPLRS